MKLNPGGEFMTKLTYERLKRAFSVCINSDFDESVISREAKNIGESESDFKQSARIYYKQMATNQERWLYDLAHKNLEANIVKRNTKNQFNASNESEYITILDRILQLNNLTDYDKLLGGYDKNYLNYLKTSIISYGNRKKDILPLPEIIAEQNKLYRILNIYNDRFKAQAKIDRNQELKELKEQKDQVKLLNAITEIDKMIQADFIMIEQYAKENNLDAKYLKECLKIIEINDKPLYDIYVDKLRVIEFGQQQINGDSIVHVIAGIKNGIKIDEDKTRPYDLIDYYLHTKMSFEEIIYVAKHICTSDEFRILKTFTSLNYHGGKFDKEAALNIKVAISGREITKEDKLAVIDFIESNEIPLCSKTYTVVLTRFLNNNMVNKEKNKTLIK